MSGGEKQAPVLVPVSDRKQLEILNGVNPFKREKTLEHDA
jgi:hypothetical protein